MEKNKCGASHKLGQTIHQIDYREDSAQSNTICLSRLAFALCLQIHYIRLLNQQKMKRPNSNKDTHAHFSRIINRREKSVKRSEIFRIQSK